MLHASTLDEFQQRNNWDLALEDRGRTILMECALVSGLVICCPGLGGFIPESNALEPENFSQEPRKLLDSMIFASEEQFQTSKMGATKSK